jgi:hypothetical protein
VLAHRLIISKYSKAVLFLPFDFKKLTQRWCEPSRTLSYTLSQNLFLTEGLAQAGSLEPTTPRPEPVQASASTIGIVLQPASNCPL